MSKLAAALILATVAHAHGDPKVCAKEPKSAKPRAMTVAVRDGQFVPGPGAEFPAVSTDGKRMAELFIEKDGSGAPIATMEIWEIAGPKEIGYEGTGGKGADPRDAPVLAEVVNRKLEGTWRPIAVYRPCDPKDASTLRMGDGLAFTLRDTLSHESKVVARTVNGAEATDMRLRFDFLGTQPGTYDGCSRVTEIAWGFGGLKEGLAVIVPGGVIAKGCSRRPSAMGAIPYRTQGDGG